MSKEIFPNIDLDQSAQNILRILVSLLPKIKPEDPRTFVGYKEVHDELKLSLHGETFGKSLQLQGLDALAEWTAKTNKPGITGLIIDREKFLPGSGYFKFFGRKPDDIIWWLSEIKKAKDFDWSKYFTNADLGVGDEWSEGELKAAVVAYLDMQVKDRTGTPFVKTHYYNELAAKFGRTAKSFEYRMQNISYVLSLMGRNWLTGLKPAKNVGLKVATRIEFFIAEIEGKLTTPVVGFEIAVREVMDGKEISQPHGNKIPQTTTSSVTQYQRSAVVKAWVLRKANGICECCSKPAPFLNFDGSGYLEIHHVIRLADDGPDTVENVVALCPNCHRELHYGERAKYLVEQLYKEVYRLKRD